MMSKKFNNCPPQNLKVGLELFENISIDFLDTGIPRLVRMKRSEKSAH